MFDFIKNFFKNPFLAFFPKKMVGVDIGTGSIKIVEISRWGQGRTLENYGEIKSSAFYENQDAFRTFEKGSYLLSDYFVARAIRAVLDEARIKTKAAIFSIPDFSTFCTIIELSPMTEKEIPDAIKFNASQYLPVSVSETALDWKIVGGKPGDKQSRLKIFLVAIPNQIVQQYQRVAEAAGLELYAIEAEALSIARSLAKDKRKTICLIDIGIQSTTINVVDRGFLKKSYSFNFAGGQLTSMVSTSLGLDYKDAEKLKNEKGLVSPEENVSKTLYILIDPLSMEIKNILNEFSQQEGRQIEEVYLTGGSANLPGLKEYFSEILKKKTEVPNSFSEILYPPILEKSLEEIGPRFSVAVGAALGGLEMQK